MAHPRIFRAIADWFSSGHTDARTQAQLERERFTLWNPACGRFHRGYVILPVLLIQMCIGSLYSWSIFNKSMDEHVWKVPGANARAFMICVAFYGMGAFFLGNWIERVGPFAAVLRTLFLTPIGWAAAAVGSYTQSLAVVYVGFGVCHGVGTACAYIATCSMMQKHFPELKGFAAGLAVCGFGIGSFTWTVLGKSLLDPAGPYKFEVWRLQLTFAIIFLTLLLACLPIMRNPPPGWLPPGYRADGERSTIAQRGWKDALLAMVVKKTSLLPLADKQYTFLEAASQLEFGLMCLLVFGMSMPGVVFLSSAADMTQYTFNYDASMAGTVTSLLNAANFTGRFGWGWVSDRLGRKAFYMVATCIQAVTVGLMGVWIERQNFGMWLFSFLLIGSLYGGSFGVLPAFVSDLFGSKISGATHGVMISIWALSSVVGTPIFTAITSTHIDVVGGVKRPTPEAYIYNTHWLCVLPAVAFFACMFLTTRAKDRILRKGRGHIRVPLWRYVLVVDCSLRNPQQQEHEYEQYMAEQKARQAVPGSEAATADGSPTPQVRRLLEGQTPTMTPEVDELANTRAPGTAFRE